MFRVVHSFYKSKSLAMKNLNQVKKKWPSAELEEDDKSYAIVFLHTDNKSEAIKILHKVFDAGLWCGIETLH